MLAAARLRREGDGSDGGRGWRRRRARAAGPAAPGRDGELRAPDRRRELRHLAGRPCARAGLRQARACEARVAQDWFAPVQRNAYEAAWMRRAAAVAPEAVPALLGQDAAAGVLVMAYLDPARHALWKTELRAGRAAPAVAAAVGERRRGSTPRPPTIPRSRQNSRPTGFSMTSVSSLIWWQLRKSIRIGRRRCGRWSRSRRRPGAALYMATSVRRTFWSGLRGRCSWMPNAPGMATRRSTSRSASTICS